MTEDPPLPFIDYLNLVDNLLETYYGITSHDCSLDQVAQAQDAGDAPEQCVEWLAEKYDLIKIPRR